MQEHEQQHFPGAQPAPETSVPPQRPVNPSVPPMGNVPPQRPVNPPVPPMGNIPPQRPVNPSVPPMGNVPPQRPVNPPVPPMGNIPPQRPVNPSVPPMGNVPPQRPVNPSVPPMGNIPPQRPVNPSVPPMGNMPIHGEFPGNVPPDANKQPEGMNWYQQIPTPGWQTPPPVPPVQKKEKEPLSPEKKDRRAAFWLKIVAVLLVLILVYCIGSDIAIYRFGLTVPGTPSAQSDMTNDSSDHGTNADASVPSGSGTGSEVVIQQQEKPEASVQAEDGSQKAADGTYTVEGVAAAVRPSIVEIYTYGDANQKQLSGTGSGIILSEDGYIITNAHVLTDGKSFTVTLSDETEYTATVVGSDSKTDLAVIHVDAKDLPAATMGDSDEVVLGEAVVAIGNPAGLTGSVTNGIVSGLNRQIQSDSTGYAMNCIQTNAAISPGNSGGALVNMYGQVIGITSSKYVSSSYEGLGFAITINDVLPIIQDLVQYGHVKDRVRIGITFISLEAEEIQIQFADALQMDSAPAGLQGIWVTEIDDSCDVGNTSLQVNDVIVKVDGKEVNNYDDLLEIISEKKPGDELRADCRHYSSNGRYEEYSIRFHLMDDSNS